MSSVGTSSGGGGVVVTSAMGSSINNSNNNNSSRNSSGSSRMSKCLICYNVYRHQCKINPSFITTPGSKHWKDKSEKLFDTLYKFLKVEPNFENDLKLNLQKTTLPFCQVCLLSVSELSVLNDQLESIQKNINDVVHRIKFTLIKSLEAVEERKAAAETISKEDTGLQQQDFEILIDCEKSAVDASVLEQGQSEIDALRNLIFQGLCVNERNRFQSNFQKSSTSQNSHCNRKTPVSTAGSTYENLPSSENPSHPNPNPGDTEDGQIVCLSFNRAVDIKEEKFSPVVSPLPTTSAHKESETYQFHNYSHTSFEQPSMFGDHQQDFPGCVVDKNENELNNLERLLAREKKKNMEGIATEKNIQMRIQLLQTEIDMGKGGGKRRRFMPVVESEDVFELGVEVEMQELDEQQGKVHVEQHVETVRQHVNQTTLHPGMEIKIERKFFPKGEDGLFIPSDENGARHSLQCHICGKSGYTNQDTLRRHIKVHGEKKYACEKCGARFHRKDSCERHFIQYCKVRIK